MRHINRRRRNGIKLKLILLDNERYVIFVLRYKAIQAAQIGY